MTTKPETMQLHVLFIQRTENYPDVVIYANPSEAVEALAALIKGETNP